VGTIFGCNHDIPGNQALLIVVAPQIIPHNHDLIFVHPTLPLSALCSRETISRIVVGTSIFSTSDFMTARDSSFSKILVAYASKIANMCDDGKVSVKNNKNYIYQKNEVVDMNIYKNEQINERNNNSNEHLSILAILLMTFRLSLVAC